MLRENNAEIYVSESEFDYSAVTKSKNIVFIHASETAKNSHTGLALELLEEELKKEDVKANLNTINLSEIITEVPKQDNFYDLEGDLERAADNFINSDIIVIGTPIRNFMPSVLLQIFFQRMRLKLITLDKKDQLVSRNFANKKVYLVVSGVSGKWKWMFLNQFLFFVYFDMLFDFWGKKHNNNLFRVIFNPQNKMKKYFIPNARKSTFCERYKEIKSHALSIYDHIKKDIDRV